MSKQARILFVDDDEAGRELSLYNLADAGYLAQGAEDGRAALARLGEQDFDLVVTDLRMPQTSGMEVLEHLQKISPDLPVVVITAHGNVEVAVAAMKAGAYDFIEKPFARQVLLLSVQRALEHRRLTLENRVLRLQARGVERPMVFVSEAMELLLRTVDRVAGSDASVLICGESGTGKELVARRVHARSDRGDGPFVTVNCAAVPGGLLESELFGHEKGAFTGAERARQGRFRQASGGTIFLDEVGEIPEALQGKLLRVLQEHSVDVVGRDLPVEVDVRVVTATNQPLLERVEQGTFRQDLYYRLDVVALEVPALRRRTEDIPALARHFVATFARGRELSIPPGLLETLVGYHWPGNVRQLQNACERLVVLCDGEHLRVEDLPPQVTAADQQPPAEDGFQQWPPLPADGLSLVDLECRVIQRVLQLKQGNVTAAAAYLGVPRHVLAYRIGKYGIHKPGADGG